ncbi:hypothetical protein WH87_14255 [Devosia epidermidihirudinis]|uniref:Glycosyl transferase family 28 C-terminal domain-containing protein n=1 Tax=Devosia epidermidihirudinis TaxID=1293439 RepID=A0A0F5Q6H4_9HYPH|nr:hypothetical protein [Devosia epidermidihirudinis]KKC36503.1 hypothetical protein WH87_14255 [Devosia epidermidihirudinis]
MVAEASVRRRFLFISNGHGEDWIAAAIAAQLPKSIEVDAYPMIGAGNAYAGVCPIVGPRATLASEGWRNVKGSLRRDLTSGGLATVPPALQFLRKMLGQYDRIVVVGDMVGVFACLATGHRGIFYLDVYKTGAARLYSSPERWAIKKTCQTVFCRSDSLARTLEHIGVDARSAGNVMMDTIPRGEYDARARRTRPLAVTLLPGSRALTAESFGLQVSALRSLTKDQRPDVFLAVAGSINVEELARQTGLRRTTMLSAEPADLGELSDGDLTIHMARGSAMGNLLDVSDVVMSQAGTATVQALGLGKPVITFINPRDRRSRFTDEQMLFGEARTVVPAEVPAISTALKHLLSDEEDRRRLANIGRQRIGGPGAMQAILDALEN